jgi:hypothetical protein
MLWLLLRRQSFDLLQSMLQSVKRHHTMQSTKRQHARSNATIFKTRKDKIRNANLNA